MLKKDSFAWSEEAENVFEALQKSMTRTPVLALPNFDQNFFIETDASGHGLGVMLMHNQKPIAFTSKTLGPRNLRLSTYEKELLANSTHCIQMEIVPTRQAFYYI